MDDITRSPLPNKKIEYSPFQLEKWSNKIPVYERVLFLDPKELYERIGDKINLTKRHAGVQMEDLFPKIEGRCACGCEKAPPSGKGWQRKWAHNDCQDFASDVLSIINNYFGKPAYYISLYSGKKCCQCESKIDLELDHIVGVKQGGGGCWLSNYRWLCKVCHNDKTNKDFNRKEYKIKIQGELFSKTDYDII